ncbi:MAG TPA: Gfo/Idh/MocA family oxidoreductase [Gaiellaceae bacterium]|nr:Gfo/Idh/MocA family oxidoreductase [Gaiellaceae bacterium]
MARAVGIGLVGVGWMGRVHSVAYRRAGDHYPECAGVARLVMAADESEDRAREAVTQLGFEGWTAEWREVIAHPEVEAVSVTVPNDLHRDVALAAAAAGKHVWIEKPAGRLPRETEEIAEAVRAAGVRSLVGFNYRQAPAVQHARRLIDGGTLGSIDHFRSQWIAAYAASPQGALSWRFLRERAGLGILGDLGSHAVDLAQFLLGPIVSVVARTETVVAERPLPTGAGTHFDVVTDGELAPVENEDVVWSIVRFERGVTGTIEASRVAVGPQARYAFEVHGSRGALAWDFERMNELSLFLALETGDDGYARVLMGPRHEPFGRFQPGPGLPMGYDDLKVVEAAVFLQSVVDGEQREPGMREALAAARVIAAMERSAASGAWQPVDGVALSAG